MIMERQVRLLILEDNAADAELAEYTLRSAGVRFFRSWWKRKKNTAWPLMNSVPT